MERFAPLNKTRLKGIRSLINGSFNFKTEVARVFSLVVVPKESVSKEKSVKLQKKSITTYIVPNT